MIALIQRVTSASVSVNEEVVGEIGKGILVLLGVEQGDTAEKAAKLAKKIHAYRIFSDENGKMNLNVTQVAGSILAVSQFTLVADTKKGNRPSFSYAGSPGLGLELYTQFVKAIRATGTTCETGKFAADMQVSLVNDGPVTFWLQV